MPYHTKLLPENLEFLQTGVRKKTLVINLNKTLISYEYKVKRVVFISSLDGNRFPNFKKTWCFEIP